MSEFQFVNDYPCVNSVDSLPEPTPELHSKNYIIGNHTSGDVYSCHWNQKENTGEWKYSRFIMLGDALDQRLDFEIKKLQETHSKLKDLMRNKNVSDEHKEAITDILREGNDLLTVLSRCDIANLNR